jgi:hypothetical protein
MKMLLKSFQKGNYLIFIAKVLPRRCFICSLLLLVAHFILLSTSSRKREPSSKGEAARKRSCSSFINGFKLSPLCVSGLESTQRNSLANYIISTGANNLK